MYFIYIKSEFKIKKMEMVKIVMFLFTLTYIYCSCSKICVSMIRLNTLHMTR